VPGLVVVLSGFCKKGCWVRAYMGVVTCLCDVSGQINNCLLLR